MSTYPDHELYRKYAQAAEASFDAARYRFAPQYIASIAYEASLDEANVRLLADFAAGADEDTLRFLWLLYYVQFESGESFWDRLDVLENLPMPEREEREHPGLCHATVCLLARDYVRRRAETLGLPEDTVAVYLANYKRFTEINMRSHGTYGFCRLAYFVYGYACHYLFDVGKLRAQYRRHVFCEVWENAASERRIFAVPGILYDETGHQNEQGRVSPVLTRTGCVLRGHLFDADGIMDLEAREYDMTGWRCVLRPGDTVLTLHLPVPKLLPEYVDEALALLPAVAARMHPELSCRAVVCRTWLLDSALKTVLPPTSNILSFQQRFDLVMGQDNENHSLFEHIFKTAPVPLDALHPINGFQEKMLERAKRGEKLYWGMGILKKR